MCVCFNTRSDECSAACCRFAMVPQQGWARGAGVGWVKTVLRTCKYCPGCYYLLSGIELGAIIAMDAQAQEVHTLRQLGIVYFPDEWQNEEEGDKRAKHRSGKEEEENTNRQDDVGIHTRTDRESGRPNEGFPGPLLRAPMTMPCPRVARRRTLICEGPQE